MVNIGVSPSTRGVNAWACAAACVWMGSSDGNGFQGTQASQRLGGRTQRLTGRDGAERVRIQEWHEWRLFFVAARISQHQVPEIWFIEPVLGGHVVAFSLRLRSWSPFRLYRATRTATLRRNGKNLVCSFNSYICASEFVVSFFAPVCFFSNVFVILGVIPSPLCCLAASSTSFPGCLFIWFFGLVWAWARKGPIYLQPFLIIGVFGGC